MLVVVLTVSAWWGMMLLLACYHAWAHSDDDFELDPIESDATEGPCAATDRAPSARPRLRRA
jgi:hypothetical protein